MRLIKIKFSVLLRYLMNLKPNKMVKTKFGIIEVGLNLFKLIQNYPKQL